jgi:hypothetical protein
MIRFSYNGTKGSEVTNMKYTRIENGHYVSDNGKITITRDYSVGYTLVVNGRYLPQMPTTLAEAKSIAEAAMRRDLLLKGK